MRRFLISMTKQISKRHGLWRSSNHKCLKQPSESSAGSRVKMSLSAGAIAGYSILGAFVGYVVTSVIFLKCPGILHKKKKRDFVCAHISHRGGAAERIENTLTAYHHAVEMGTQMLEIDVHFSKDKKVVVSHDEDLQRVAGSEQRICDCDYEDLPLLKDEINVTFYGGVTCQNKGNQEKMPTLEQVFLEFPNIPINVDVKGESEGLCEAVHSLIKQFKREKITVWGNFRSTTTEKLYKLDSEIPIFFSMRRVAFLYLWFYTGLLPFIPLKETHLEIILPDVFNRVEFSFSRGQRIILSVLGFLVRSKVLFDHLKGRGIPTYLWVLNEEEDFKTAFELGVEGVMTDCPTKLTKWLDENPQYWKR
ncbi:lysophospholipase D GDPD1-like isoform X1 [Clavelina lepadiformis]|uniref:lysophospholipase D GDPD1-like isoform X1 n=2 Tax=Clavelina lepadiformis TaxID=159417 RepID=UPI0040435A3F